MEPDDAASSPPRPATDPQSPPAPTSTPPPPKSRRSFLTTSRSSKVSFKFLANDGNDTTIDQEEQHQQQEQVQVQEQLQVSRRSSTGHSRRSFLSSEGSQNSFGTYDDGSQEIKFYPWYLGGGCIPRNGADLGVYDESLEDRANIFQLWFLTYLNPLMSLGSRKVLDADDIGVPSEQDKANLAYKQGRDAWILAAYANDTDSLEEVARTSKNFTINSSTRELFEPLRERKFGGCTMFSLITSFGGLRIYIAVLCYVLAALLNFIPVLILNDLVSYFEHRATVLDQTDTQHEKYETYFPLWTEVVALGIIPLISSTLQARHQVIMVHYSVFARTALSTLVYRKSLWVSTARSVTSTGRVVNMMSNDTKQLQRFLMFGGMIVVAPLQVLIAIYLVYQQVGNATWVGVAYMAILAPVNSWVFSMVTKMRKEVLHFSDLRVKMMNEILVGIRILKFYAWERPFLREVGELRKHELRALTKLTYITSVGFSIILLSTPVVQPVLVFLTYVNVQNQTLTAATAFTTVALFSLMRFPFSFMPMYVLQFLQSQIALRRLQQYLSLPELDVYVILDPPPLDFEDIDDETKISWCEPNSITINNGFFSWGAEVQNENNDNNVVKDSTAATTRGEEDSGSSGAGAAAAASGVVNGKSDMDGNSDCNSNGKAPGSLNGHAIPTSIDTNQILEEGAGISASDPPIVLNNITCHIPAGKLVAVVGPVGSGKSSFLSAILGEMQPLNSSKVYIPLESEFFDDSCLVSYCTQSPWVINATLKDNILFGRTYDEARYEQVLEACALIDDLEILPAGDKTEIGERGINVSGGQKARIALARALYSNLTRIVLMDDPLSAVDGNVAEHLFTKAISGNLCKNMTRVLVTHQEQFLPRCDYVIVLENGCIKNQGTYKELIWAGVDFEDAVEVPVVIEEPVEPKELISKSKRRNKRGKSSRGRLLKKSVTTRKKLKDVKKQGENLMGAEEKEEGSVTGSAYSAYLKAGGYFPAIMVVVVQGIGRASEILGSFWLALWTEQAVMAQQSNKPHTKAETNLYIGIYGLLGFLSVCGLGGRGFFLAWHRLGASKKLHDDLTQTIMWAPVSFFDITPLGRILNRFAADMDRLDLELTQTISQNVGKTFSILGAIGAIAAASKGTFLVLLFPVGVVYYYIQKWFRKTSTELQRITSIANSPIFADFSQALSGTSTIRAYGVQKRFFKHCKNSFDRMNTAFILFQLTVSWLALRLDVLGGVIAAFIGGIAVATQQSNFIPAGWLGLALAYSTELTVYLKFGVQMISRLEADMSSVQRILYYTHNVESEPPETIPDKDPQPSEWPNEGTIEFDYVSFRYRGGPRVLKDVVLTIKGGEKVGVCGRTGSGKSSLMNALFRISEIDVGGAIIIDGIDIKTIGTAILRHGISIIPQEPVMFSNTVRYNLDPFLKATDKEIWDALDKVHMSKAITVLPSKLDAQVAEGGKNFSQGQRQLICIARALLSKPKILVMDEATASIDSTTDTAIQDMIRENFSDITVLTIAHRLNTIMDSDKILVLDEGRVAEFDSPEALLAREKSIFKSMVDQSIVDTADDDDDDFDKEYIVYA